MATPQKDKNDPSVCTIIIAFPIVSMDQVVNIKANIDEVLKPLDKVRCELRMIDMRGGSDGMDRP